MAENSTDLAKSPDTPAIRAKKMEFPYNESICRRYRDLLEFNNIYGISFLAVTIKRVWL